MKCLACLCWRNNLDAPQCNNHFNSQAPPPPPASITLPSIICNWVTVNGGNWKMFLSNTFHDIEIFLHLIRSGLGCPATPYHIKDQLFGFLSALQRIFTGHSLNNKINKCESWCYVCRARACTMLSRVHICMICLKSPSLNCSGQSELGWIFTFD